MLTVEYESDGLVHVYHPELYPQYPLVGWAKNLDDAVEDYQYSVDEVLELYGVTDLKELSKVNEQRYQEAAQALGAARREYDEAVAGVLLPVLDRAVAAYAAAGYQAEVEPWYDDEDCHTYYPIYLNPSQFSESLGKVYYPFVDSLTEVEREVFTANAYLSHGE